MGRIKDRKRMGHRMYQIHKDDDHGNIEFLMEQDGDWAGTWEPRVNGS